MRRSSDETVAIDNAMPRLTTFASPTTFTVLFITLALAFFPADTSAQGGTPPPGGIVYFGEATASGERVPDGFEVVARIGDYESNPVTVSKGRYASLSVASSHTRHVGQTINFFLGDVQADQTDIYQPYGIPVIKTGFNLTFSKLPELTPTAQPSAIPNDTPVAAPTQPPTPTQPTAPAQPSVPTSGEPMVFISGLVVVLGVPQAPADSILVARIGDDYQSEPADEITTDGTYAGLLVDPGDTSLEGAEIRFFLNGIPARTTAIYQSGRLERNFDILFTEYPTPPPTFTPIPEDTPTPIPTNTPVPTETSTVVPPTSTPVPTQTPVPSPTPGPTNTPAPPTSTPTPTPEPTQAQTAPPSAPTPSPEEAGGCFSVANLSPLTGAANTLLLIAPLGLIIGLRSARRRRR